MPKVQTFDFLKNIDSFSEAVPTFNIDGHTEIKTFPGALITLTISLLTFIFGVMKIQHLLERKNPTINTNDEPLDEGTTYFLDNEEFMMAFAAERYDNFNGLSDP